MLAHLALILAAAAGALAQDPSFECAVATYALALSSAKLPAAAAPQLRDALNIDYVCQNSSHAAIAAAALAPLAEALAAERALHTAAREGLARAASAPGTLATFYVAPTGSDSSPGTQAQPFATLQRAAAAARAVPGRAAAGDVAVLVRGGTYYMGLGGPLVLGPADSNVSYSAYPGERVVLSGAMSFAPGSLAWAPSATGVPGTLVAALPGVPVDARALAWGARPGPRRAGAAGPPPLVSSLFLNGTRQVRARYPNGNPQDGTGICFSATQRPGEGCAAYSTCALGQTGRQPAPSGLGVALGPNRGDSPTLGCSQCHNCDSFKYSIYPPPPDHPVYNAPLPGVGWSNTSVFSFWASPFDRPAGVLVDAAGCSEGSHWLGANYSSGGVNAVVHMFHSGLWGGWQYAVDSVELTYPSLAQPAAAPEPAAAAAAAAPPPPSKAGLALWLRADTLAAAGAADGAPLSAWADVSSGSGLSARQGLAAKQPVFLATGGALGAATPVVRFRGSSVLQSAQGDFGAATTQFAVLVDTGSATDYCSGVFSVLGGQNSLCTKAAAEPPGSPADDDPKPAGTPIIAAALDWGGSPADPGHRDLAHRPIVLSAVYSALGAASYVSGCLELDTQSGTGHAGTGFTLGTRGDEMGRYLTGDVAEVLVYNRALNASEHASVVAYLLGKYGLAAPKHCAPPPPPGAQLKVNFGYGGYQEARGSGINKGQHFYIENVREELDAPGEWWFDAAAALLYYLPNATLAELQGATLALPLLDSVLVVNGSSSSSSLGGVVQNVGFAGFTITQTRTTFLEMYEVPSGGDWSVHRGGAVHVQGAANVTLAGLLLDQVGGNGVLFSNSVTDSTIADCEFVHSGDSAVVLLGSTEAIDGSAPTFPNRNAVLRNHMHEVGVYGKQTSCFAQQLSAQSRILDNVCYNGPRAGVNL